jgi:chromosome segregation ATPase
MALGTSGFRVRRLLRGPDTIENDPQPGAHPEESAEPAPARTALAVESCRVVLAGAEEALLRVSGRWTPATPTRVELFVALGYPGEVFSPLPPGPTVADDGLWSAAFAVPAAAAGARCALVSPVSGVITLAPSWDEAPAPAEAPTEPDRDATAELEHRLAEALDDLSDARAVVSQLRRRCEMSERGLADFRDKLVQAWSESGELRDLLDSREAAHETAKERERTARAIVDELEARAARSEDELARRRTEMEEQCARLEAELTTRSAAGEAADALRRDVDEALARFEAARAEAAELRSELDEARTRAESAAAEAERAALETETERARASEASESADVYSERLAKAERELGEARTALAVAEARAEVVAGEAAHAEGLLESERERAGEAERAAGELREQLKASDERVTTLETEAAEAAGLRRRIETETERVRELEEEIIGLNERLGEAGAGESELVEKLRAESSAMDHLQRKLEAETAESKSLREQLEAARAELASAESRASQAQGRLTEIQSAQVELARSEQAARQELGALTRTDLGEKGSLLSLRGSKVSARAHREALEQLETEREGRTQLQDEAKLLAARVGELEQELAAQSAAEAGGGPSGRPNAEVVEGDLRHLLEVRERELEAVRVELADYRTRYSTVASQVPPAELPEPPRDAGDRDAEPWSAVDQDLLERIARAKALAGQD